MLTRSAVLEIGLFQPARDEAGERPGRVRAVRRIAAGLKYLCPLLGLFEE